jgi:hypothetical protein
MGGWSRRSLLVLLAVAATVAVLIVGARFVLRPGSSAADAALATAQGVEFKVTSVEIADRWGLNVPDRTGDAFLVVQFDCSGAGASVDPMYIADLAYLTHDGGARTPYAILDTRSDWPSGPLAEGETRRGTWVFEVPEAGKGFVLHFADGPTVNLDPLLGN